MTPAPLERLRPVLLTIAIGLLVVLGLTRANAAKPTLRGVWPLEGLLPFDPNPAVVATMLWIAIALGTLAVVLGLVHRPSPVTWRIPLVLALVALIATPIGSGDHLNYAAYGRILLGGGDPWVESPIAWAGGHDPITSAVEEPWTTEPSVYGPFATLLQAAAAAVGGDHLRLVVLAWQVVVVLAWLGVRLGLRACLPTAHGRIDVLWTLNPLVVSVGLLGAHVDTLATALVVAAVAALRVGSRGVVVAGIASGLAATTKFTYAVVVVAIILTWVVPRLGAACVVEPSRLGGCTRRIGLLLLGFLPTVAVLHAWTGPHVYDQIARARSSVSLASSWRLVLNALKPELGNGTARSIVSLGAMALAVTVAALILRRVHPVGDDVSSTHPATLALVTTAGLATAYSLAAPYTLPWYDLLAWAALPAVLPGVLDGILLARLAVISAAYVPGRVLGMTPEVERVTLGLRTAVAPWLNLALWVAAGWLLTRGDARVGSVPTTSPAPPGSGPRPRR